MDLGTGTGRWEPGELFHFSFGSFTEVIIFSPMRWRRGWGRGAGGGGWPWPGEGPRRPASRPGFWIAKLPSDDIIVIICYLLGDYD